MPSFAPPAAWCTSASVVSCPYAVKTLAKQAAPQSDDSNCGTNGIRFSRSRLTA
jgi:hypothetical protein